MDFSNRFISDLRDTRNSVNEDSFEEGDFFIFKVESVALLRTYAVLMKSFRVASVSKKFAEHYSRSYEILDDSEKEILDDTIVFLKELDEYIDYLCSQMHKHIWEEMVTREMQEEFTWYRYCINQRWSYVVSEDNILFFRPIE